MKPSNIRDRIDSAIKGRATIRIRAHSIGGRDGILAYPYQSGTNAAGEEKVLVMTADDGQMKCLSVSDFKEVEYDRNPFRRYEPPRGGAGGSPCIMHLRMSNLSD